MKKIKIGVMGLRRGLAMIDYCLKSDRVELVAICDNWKIGLKLNAELHADKGITYYEDFDAFIQHDMDAVVLANYATEHAPFAIKAMKAGKHVWSEVLPCQTMKEAVELVETVEETGKVYAYGENYCYMPALLEMRRLYREGVIGEFEYGECEYIHNTTAGRACLMYGDKNHWRNNSYSTFYCTHSIGPILFMTGLRPVSVTGYEGQKVERSRKFGAKSGAFGIEMITLENDGLIKSIHGSLYKDSVWYCAYGSKGSMETARDITKNDGTRRIYVNADDGSGKAENVEILNYMPGEDANDGNEAFGHSGSDFYCMDHFVRKLQGDDSAMIIDVYEALDMFLPGMFAYRSILQGGVPVEVPDLRDKAQREKYRNDTACTDPKVAGDQLLPTFSKGTPDIPDELYTRMKQDWLDSLYEQLEDGIDLGDGTDIVSRKNKTE